MTDLELAELEQKREANAKAAAERSKQDQEIQDRIDREQEAERKVIAEKQQRSGELKAGIKARAEELALERLLGGIYVPEPTYIYVFEFAKPVKGNESKKLVELFTRRDAAREKVVENGSDAASAFYRGQHGKLLEAARENKDGPADVYTLNECKEEFQKRRSAFKQVIREIDAEIKPIIDAIYKRASVCADELANRVEQSERIEAKKFFVEFKPSYLVLVLRAAAFHLNRGLGVETAIKIIQQQIT